MTAPSGPRNLGLFDLSARAKLRVTGSDRLRFLNGQVTNDVAKATISNAVPAAVLNVKGKMDGVIFLSATADALWIDTEAELREKLQARLERYVIADDVQIEDLSARWSLFHVLSTTAPKAPENCRIVGAERYREPGWDVWIEATGRDAVFQSLADAFPFCDDACAEVFRVERGIPRWGRELSDQIIPVEASLEESCIDYEKGCYIGQEIISRMKISGQRNKKLCGLISVHDSPLEPGMLLFPIGAEQKEVGWVTSAVRSKRLAKEIALGFMKRPFLPPGFKLDALDPENPFGSRPVRVEFVDLPFFH